VSFTKVYPSFLIEGSASCAAGSPQCAAWPRRVPAAIGVTWSAVKSSRDPQMEHQGCAVIARPARCLARGVAACCGSAAPFEVAVGACESSTAQAGL
jgi:hypothetical protein